jgi:c-di-GMP-related signal transduction protein
MRVKLSYTVEEEDILKEAAKILGLSQEDMGHAIKMFKEVQEELLKEDEVNISTAIEMIEDFRKALRSVDTRLSEVGEIVDAYQSHQIATRTIPGPSQNWTDKEDYYGAD